MPDLSHAPRDIRDMNPGNIMGRDASGKMTYMHYASFAAGFAAMRRQINIDYARHGLHTIRDLIMRWNPPNAPGNNQKETQNYINSVARALGVDPNAQFDYTQPGAIGKLMLAMTNVESGTHKYDALLSAGVAASLGGGVIVNNTANVTVNNARDAHETARQVKEAVQNVQTSQRQAQARAA